MAKSTQNSKTITKEIDETIQTTIHDLEDKLRDIKNKIKNMDQSKKNKIAVGIVAAATALAGVMAVKKVKSKK